MTAKRTIKRTEPSEWLLTRDGDKISIARSEHSDWVDVPLSAVQQLLADLRELAEADAPMIVLQFVR